MTHPRRRTAAWFLVLFGATVAARDTPATPNADQRGRGNASMIVLPQPDTRGRMSVEEALYRRRSVRHFSAAGLTRRELGQLLWAAQGITSTEGFRTAPSAGATYPLEVYVETAVGVFRYVPHGHRMQTARGEDVRAALERAAGGQDSVGAAPAVVILTAVPGRTAKRYGSRAERYVRMEAGHAAQNVLLSATALGLGAVPVGAFDDAQLQRVLGLPRDQVPLYLIPIGHPR